MAFSNQPLSIRRGNPVLGVILFGGFTLMGSALVYALLVHPVLRVWAARSWHQTDCRIVSGQVVYHSGNKGPTYSVEIVFKYHVGGQHYQSRHYDFMEGSTSGYDDKQAVVDRYPPGMRTVCYVNPSDPTDAVLDRDYPHDMWFGFVALIFPLIGIGGFACMWLKPPASS